MLRDKLYLGFFFLSVQETDGSFFESFTALSWKQENRRRTVLQEVEARAMEPQPPSRDSTLFSQPYRLSKKEVGTARCARIAARPVIARVRLSFFLVLLQIRNSYLARYKEFDAIREIALIFAGIYFRFISRDAVKIFQLLFECACVGAKDSPPLSLPPHPPFSSANRVRRGTVAFSIRVILLAQQRARMRASSYVRSI